MIFGAPAFLWGLLALAIPVAVHLFNFRRYRKVYFSNVERLSAIRAESQRSSTLRRWLVLAMRCLAIIALVLAFAQPTLPGKQQTLHSGSTVVSVYIDNSFSMENSGADGSLLDQARQKAREVVAAYRYGDRYQLLSNNMSGDEMRWLSRDEFLDAVDQLAITPATRTLAEVARRQSDFMAQSGAPNRHAYLISDCQLPVCDFDNLPADTLSRFTLVPLEGVSADNLSIDTLRLDAPAYFVGGSVTAEVTVANHGSHDVEKLPVKLFINGRERAIATLDLPAGAQGKASLSFTLDSAGWQDGCIQIADYPVTFDDNYYFSLLAGERIAMLQVDGIPTAGDDPLRRLFGADSAIIYNNGALPPDLSFLHFIILNQVASLSSGQSQALASWVDDGGTLTIIPPPPSSSSNFSFPIPHFSLNASWNRRTVKADGIDYNSSLYRNVFGGRSSEMELPTIQGGYSLDGLAVSQPIITLPGGGALLVSIPSGNGRLYLFSTPLSSQYTDFASQALFVPTLYNMALYSRPLPPVAHTLGSLDPIPLQQVYDPAATPPELTSPLSELRILPDLRRIGNRSVIIPHGELSQAGHYTLGSEHLAFNYDRRESRLEFLSHSDIVEALAQHPSLSVVRNADKPLDEEIRSRDGGTPLWRWCILLTLAALLTETLLLTLRKPRKSSEIF